jgi:hypothetical protein
MVSVATESVRKKVLISMSMVRLATTKPNPFEN